MNEFAELFTPTPLVINILVGIAILVAGRRLFWLAVGAVGFLAGLGLALNYLNIESMVVLLLVGLVAGVIGIVIALFLQQVAIIISGFLMGGYLSLEVVNLLNVEAVPWEWLIFIVGGIIGAIIVSALFEYALIVISAMVGAAMITQPLNLSPEITAIAWLGLFIIGLVIQGRLSNPAPRQSTSTRRSR